MMRSQKNIVEMKNKFLDKNSVDFEKIRITNDVMFCTIFRNPDECRELLQRILGIEIAELSITEQKEIKSHVFHKGISLDIYVKDSNGNVYDIEMQISNTGELDLRSRYYHSEMDGYQIHTGVKYASLKDSIVIFICDFDLFGKGNSVYTFETICREYPELTLEDKRKTLFLNIHGERIGLSNELSALLDYFETSDPKDDYTKRLEEKVRDARNDDDWRENYMTLEMKLDERYRLGIEKGREEGENKKLMEQVRKKLQKGKSISVIAEECEEEESEIQKIIASINEEKGENIY